VPVAGRVRTGKRFGGTIAFLHYVLLLPLSAARRYRLVIPLREKWRSETHNLEVTPLRGEIKERWRELCERAAVEQDPDRFLATIQELLRVLEDREERRRSPAGLRMPPGEKSPRLSCPLAS
jgi:hypothetical protein